MTAAGAAARLVRRALEAEAKLKDYGERQQPVKAAGLLPSALSAFDEVSGPPEFLDPEAIRPMATAAAHLSGQLLVGGGPAAPDPGMGAEAGWHGPKGRIPPGQTFDIARLAPPGKGQKKDEAEARGLPSGAIIQGAAKRYKADDGPEATQQYSALQIAMLGGKVADKAAVKGPVQLAGAGAGGPGCEPPPRVPSKAMPVTDFLDKGVGGSLLPRKAQDRRDKEKSKRERGQSSIGSWKTEAEMALRQQYDS
ncbi:hypothetical protein V8C86DRAFT_576849 [Haematococcus lacustris]